MKDTIIVGLQVATRAAFLISYYFFGLKVAAYVLIGVSLVQVLVHKYFKVPIKTMEKVNISISLIVGIFIYFFDKPQLLMLKPTIVGALICLTFLTSAAFDFRFAQKMFKTLNLSAKASKLDVYVALYGATLCILNEFVRKNLIEQQWVYFKTIGVPILTVIFMVILVSKNQKDND
jgi:intracellular septation protein A